MESNNLYFVVYRDPYKTGTKVSSVNEFKSEEEALSYLKKNAVGIETDRTKSNEPQRELHAIYKINFATGNVTHLEMKMSQQFKLSLVEKEQTK